MLGRRREDVEQTGEAVVTSAEAQTVGEATVWELRCRIEAGPESEPLTIQDRIGGALDSARDLHFAAGDLVPVRYDPARPQDARVDVAEIRRRAGARDTAPAGGSAQVVNRQLERRHPPLRPTGAPGDSAFWLEVSDVLAGGDRSTVTGRVTAGTVRVGDTIQISGRTVTVVTLQALREPLAQAAAGQHVAVGVDGLSSGALLPGDVISGIR